MHAAASAAPGLDLFEDVVDHESEAEILDLVDAHIAQGRAGTLACKSYVAPPADWRRTGQGRETILFGVHVKCNKVQNAAVLPLPPLLEALLDRLQARGIFAASERPDTCCVNAYEAGSWLPPHVDSAAFDRPFFTLSLLSVQEVVFGEAIGGADGEWTGPVRLALPLGSVLRVGGAAADSWMHALPRATARRVSLTFRRLSEPTRARFAALQEAADAAGIARRERRLEAKLARGWRPRPTGDAEVEPQPMVVTEAPAGRRRCCQCGILFDACGVELASAGVACSVACVKARARQRSAHGWAPNLSYPNLEFGRYRAQRLFHPIDLAHPGLQLVHEEPYIFVCHNFLSAAECALLIDKAQTAPLDQQLVGESSASHRTSTGCVLHRDESQQLRRRIAALANVGEAQLQPLKVSRYEKGQHFAEHCDAVDGDGEVDTEVDYYADRARRTRGTRACPHPGANRFVTVFVYLNDVKEGGRTRWRWTKSVPGFYAAPAPSGMSCTTLAGEEHEVAIRPEAGMAVVHFPATTAESGGVTDRNASHESEEARDTKWVVQSFVWSHPVPADALAGTVEPARPLSETRF